MNKLQVQHTKSSAVARANDSADNLITLCGECHGTPHGAGNRGL